MQKYKIGLTLLLTVLMVFLVTVVCMAETLEWWTGTFNEIPANKLKSEFEAQNPGINVEVSFISWEGMYEKYVLALKTGNAPDVLDIAVGWGYELANAGFLLPLDKYIEKSETDFSDWMDGAWDTAVIGDSVYGIPYRGDCYCLFYNKDLFRKAGLDPNKPPQDWNEYLKYAITISSELKDVYGSGIISAGEPLNLTARVLPFVYQNNGSILNEDKTKAVINQKPAVEAIRWVTDLYTKYHVEPKSNIQNNAVMLMELFKSGKIAMAMGAQYNITEILNETDIELGTAIMPANPDTGKRTVEMGGWNLTIPKDAKNPEAAFKFIEFLTQPDNMAQLTHALPARKAAFESKYLNKDFSNPLFEANKEQLNYGILFKIPYENVAKNIFTEEFQHILIGSKDVQEAMDDAARRIDEILNK